VRAIHACRLLFVIARLPKEVVAISHGGCGGTYLSIVIAKPA